MTFTVNYDQQSGLVHTRAYESMYYRFFTIATDNIRNYDIVLPGAVMVFVSGVSLREVELALNEGESLGSIIRAYV